MQFDIVIPVGPSDVGFIQHMVTRVKQHIQGYGSIYIISKSDPKILDCTWISEEVAPFPFTFAQVAEGCSWLPSRTGWYYQQLLKLYANQGIPELQSTYLVIDADAIFLKDTSFFKEGQPCYAVGDEYHVPYFQHMKRMHPLFQKYHTQSGIAHHMIFQKQYVQEIIDLVEIYHKKPFWQVFLECVEENYISGASEYELYFNYMHHMHPECICIRPLFWRNGGRIIQSDYVKGYNYVAVHNYRRCIHVCYPYTKQMELEHIVLYNSLLESTSISIHPSCFGEIQLTESILLDWMRDRLADLKDNVLLFVLPDVLVNSRTLDDLFDYLWEIEDPLTCIQNADGLENMRVLLVDSTPEVHEVFQQITSLSQLGTKHFVTSNIRTDTTVEDPWWIVDIPNPTKAQFLYETSKHMDISELLPILPTEIRESVFKKQMESRNT